MLFSLKVESIYLCTDGACFGDTNDKLRRKVSVVSRYFGKQTATVAPLIFGLLNPIFTLQNEYLLNSDCVFTLLQANSLFLATCNISVLTL